MKSGDLLRWLAGDRERGDPASKTEVGVGRLGLTMLLDKVSSIRKNDKLEKERVYWGSESSAADMSQDE
jgi:hypothetical protein